MDKLLLERTIEIRNNWKDVEKLKVLIDAWDQEFGHEYDEVVERVIGKYLEEMWAKKAEERGSNSLDDLLSILLDFPDGKYTKEAIERGFKVTTTFCPIAESFRAINRADYGAIFYCISDPYICRGFNAQIKHRKISSRMQGDKACVHFYTMQP
jgi:hypothetical protein